ADRDVHVVRGQILDVRGVHIRRDDVRDVHDERDPTSPDGRRGRSGADREGKDAIKNQKRAWAIPRGGRPTSSFDGWRRGNRGSAVRREGEGVTRRGRGRRPETPRERGRTCVEQQYEEDDEPDERDTAHGTPVTMKCDAI